MKNLFIVILLGILFGFTNSFSAEMPPASKPDKELTEEEADLRIGSLRQDVKNLEAELEEAKGKHNETKNMISEAQKSVADCDKAILDLINATQADIDAFRKAFGEIRNRVREMQKLSNDELADRRDEVQVLEADLNKLRMNKISLLEEFYQPIIDLAREIKGLYREKKTTTYTVRPWATSKDCLWNIAGRTEILGDPNQWPKLWQANRDEIRNPDIIYPGQVLEIPKKGEMDAEAKKMERQYYRQKRDAMQATTGETTESGETAESGTN